MSTSLKFSYGRVLLIGLGVFSINLLWGPYNAFVPVFLAERFSLAPGMIGVFMALDNVAALLIQTPTGAWSDQVQTSFGRRLPFILIGAPLGALAAAFIPLANALPLFMLGTVIMMISMAVWRTPVMALVIDITPSPKRSNSNSIMSLLQGLGGIVAYLGGAALYDINPAYPFWLAAGLMLLAILSVAIFVREPKQIANTERSPGLWHSLSELMGSSQNELRRLLLAIFCWSLAFNILESFFSLYAIHHLGLEDSAGARLLGQFALVWILFSIPAGFIGARFGRRRSIMTGLILFSLALLCMFFTPVAILTIPLTRVPLLGALYIISPMLVLAGAALSLMLVQALPMVADMTDAGRTGTYTGLYYLASTLSAIIGPSLFGWVIEAAGNNYNLIMLAAPLCAGAALLLIRGVKRGEAVSLPVEATA
jgi:maltose/moltooligosaccharide transporter